MTLLIVTISTILCLIIGLYCYRLTKQQRTHLAMISDLQNQLTALGSGTVSTDQRLIDFERSINKLKEQQGNLNASLAPQHNYDHAIRLAKKGVASNQLIDRCNLSDEEAHLIERMHGDKENAPFH